MAKKKKRPVKRNKPTQLVKKFINKYGWLILFILKLIMILLTSS